MTKNSKVCFYPHASLWVNVTRFTHGKHGCFDTCTLVTSMKFKNWTFVLWKWTLPIKYQLCTMKFWLDGKTAYVVDIHLLQFSHILAKGCHDLTFDLFCTLQPVWFKRRYCTSLIFDLVNNISYFSLACAMEGSMNNLEALKWVFFYYL